MSNKVYLETTIPSYLAAKPARDLLQAAHQQITHDWWDQDRSKYELFISSIVWDEVKAGDPQAAQRRVELIDNLPMLVLTPDVDLLVNAILQSKILPAKAARDVIHISVTSVHEIDYLLTWNCTHIANPTIMKELRKIVTRFGYDFPVICTPEELLGATHGNDP